MGHVIVTSVSLLWILLTVISSLAVFYALFTPKWLIGPQRISYGENGSAVALGPPSVGVFNRCTRMDGERSCGIFAMDGLSTDSNVFPTFWKISLVFFTLGITVMAFTAMAALLSCCIQSVNKKSIFTVTGSVQALAGLFYILGIIMYSAGWGSARVVRLCGPESQPFYLGDCSIGWSVYSAIFGILLTLITASLSVYAEKTTSSDKVSEHVEKGETLVCLL
ncbi:unnamed protein product [Nezara viridula]|uniref:Lipoma HMGIC fusion partner-like 2 protein n=1 Tax=Nezara viridula TaxID=85310 RepID=A0A9P0E2C0_NEZVI|nr:unnamed protein product [Nezara viridula]